MLIWVSIFLLLIVIEAFIGDFSALTISVGAIASILIALLGLDFPYQVIGFSLVSLSSLLMFRPFLQNKFIPPEHHLTANAYIGSYATVLDEINPDQKGRIKVGGEIWFAESYCKIEAGQKVIISEIDNVIMKVLPEEHIIEKKINTDLLIEEIKKKSDFETKLEEDNNI